MRKLKSKLNLVTGLILTITIFTSCGGGGKQTDIAKVKPEKVEISGDLSDYLQVVDNEYEITDDFGGKLTIKVKAIKPISAEEFEANEFNLSASLLAENGTPVSGTGEFTVDFGYEDKLRSLLKKGSGEEVIQLKEVMGNYKAEEHAGKVKKFTVSSTMAIKEATETSTTDSLGDSNISSEEPISETGSEDWDKMLNDYDAYVTDYIRIYKKAMKGDNSAILEYPALMEKANALSESMKAAQNENKLSTKQVARMAKIQVKMLEAASEN